MANRDNLVFIELLNFNREANKVVNKAILISSDTECGDVNTVHLFLAMLESTRYGRKVLDYLGATYDMIYTSFQTLAESGEYGRLNSDNIEFSPEYFSNDMIALIGISTQLAFLYHKTVTPQALWNNLLRLNSAVLAKFFEHIGFDPDEMSQKEQEDGDLYIPDELREYVEDVNSSKIVKESVINNVDKYTDEMIEILARKKKANPCLIGEAGVGKTTIVNRLAQLINEGKVPDSMKNTKIVYINGSTLTSGTRYRGDFEERMKNIMDWASEQNVILFLDEVHTFINSGDTGRNSGETAGNMIKKHLADGSIRIIGATTLKEYHQFIESDKAFNRRLQTVEVKEPTVDEAIDMLKNTVKEYETYHGVKIDADAVEVAVKMSDRYIKDNFLPDKAYTVIDQACAKAKLAGKKSITESMILDVISNTAGVDVNKLGKKEAKHLMNLESTIRKSLVGQENAVKTVCKAIRRAKAGVREPGKPIASFLFVGPTGVGKTELCKVLSKEIAFGETPLIRIDMSEYNEKSSISKMIGSAPGYVGYGEGGQLTEKVKHNPFSIVLFDEIEKAHPEVFNTFLQLLDDGRLTDGEGTTVDFTNCIIVMTSNAGYGADGLAKKALGFGAEAVEIDAREAERRALKALEETFKPEFLNRIDNVVIFDKLTKEQCGEIVKLGLNKVAKRLEDRDIKLKFDKSVVDSIVENGYDDKYGARNINREIQDTVEDALADAILLGNLKDGDTKVVKFNTEIKELVLEDN